MKKIFKSVLASLVLVPCLMLAACGAMNIKGKTFKYESVKVEFVGEGTENETELENMKQTATTKYSTTTMQFKDDDTVTLAGETDAVYYVQDGKEVKLYSNTEKTEAYSGAAGSDLKVCVDGKKVVITFKGATGSDDANYKYTVTFVEQAQADAE